MRTLSTRLAKRTVADTCSSLRAFLRFLRITGKLSVDVASGVIAPRYRIDERPPRILRWKDVQKTLHVISRSQAPGKRDFAILLLLATYGLGAAEVLALRLQDVDWRAGTFFCETICPREKGRTGPRPYDLRHAFAMHRLSQWYSQGVDLHSRLPWLSAYMGHVDIIGTENYLNATPELLALAGNRLRRRYKSAGGGDKCL